MQTATEGSGQPATVDEHASQPSTANETEIHMTCGKCHTDFFSVDRLMEHINTPCNFFLQREQALQGTRPIQHNRRNDLNQIIAGREMTRPDIREAVRAHVAKANRKAARVSRHFNAEEQFCVCRPGVPPPPWGNHEPEH